MTAPAPARVRPGRVATFATSVGLTLSAAVVSLLGVLPAAPAAASEPTSWWPTGPLQRLVGQAPGGVDGGEFVEPPSRRAVPAAGRERLVQQPPAGSGAGRRVVFDESAQQVWLVRDGGSVRATYLVSGSVHDNVAPGRYEVYSRSLHATAFDYSSTMDFMVRFAQGATAAIGFHDIPTDGTGEPVQRVTQLGTPTSSGCIRQRPRDAREMWRFAQVGTAVVVVA